MHGMFYLQINRRRSPSPHPVAPSVDHRWPIWSYRALAKAIEFEMRFPLDAKWVGIDPNLESVCYAAFLTNSTVVAVAMVVNQ